MMWDGLADTYCLLAGYRRGALQVYRRGTSRVYGHGSKRIRWSIIVIVLLWAALMIGGANAQETCETCGTPEPTAEPRPDYPENESNPPPPPEWTGLSDGRLNPDPAEYYSIWCSHDLIRVRRVVPEPAEIKVVSLATVIAYPTGIPMDLGDYMSLVRNTVDTITIYGSNGNGAPEPGEKAFSLGECIARNGGPPPPPEQENLDSEAGNGDSGVIPFECWDKIGLDFISCIIENPDSGLEILFKYAFQLCFGALVMIPGGFALRSRRRRK